jgi:hypothetical protein
MWASRALVAVILLFSSALAEAQPIATTEPTYKLINPTDAIRGLRTIGVVVEDIPELSNILEAQTLRTNIELRLRQAGITVPDASDKLSSVYPQIYLNCNVLKLKAGNFVYNISLEFKRLVEVHVADSSDTNLILGSLRSQETIGIVPANEAGQTIREVVNDKVSAFLNAYLAANPKK